jgi:epoxide hydrolase 4
VPGIAHSRVAANGIVHHVASAGAGPLMLFLHGFPELWRAWRAQLEHFSARAWLAAAPDLRGYNLTDKPPEVAQYRSKHVVEDVRQLGLALGGGRPFVLVAHDWGGAAAWGLALAHPELLSHLVIVNSPHPYVFWREMTRNPAQQKASAYMLMLRAADAEQRLSANGYEQLWRFAFGWLSAAAMPEEERQAYLEAWSQPGALTGSLNWYRASPLYPPTPDDPGPQRLSLRPQDFVVRVPTLVLWGERDRALLPGCLDGLSECVPDLEIVRVPGASHWIVHERPDLVNDAIERFVSRERER